jgi:hypothetical protein
MLRSGMTLALIGANTLLALALLLFVRESRREWAIQRSNQEQAEHRFKDSRSRDDDQERRLTNGEIRLDNYLRQLRSMQEQIGWSDDRAHTRVIQPHERFGGPPPLPEEPTDE